jgi:hypothetical protein
LFPPTQFVTQFTGGGEKHSNSNQETKQQLSSIETTNILRRGVKIAIISICLVENITDKTHN